MKPYQGEFWQVYYEQASLIALRLRENCLSWLLLEKCWKHVFSCLCCVRGSALVRRTNNTVGLFCSLIICDNWSRYFNSLVAHSMNESRQQAMPLKRLLIYVLKMMYYSMNDAGILGKRKSECSYQESNLRPSNITSSDALPLSYRRLVGAKAIKLGSIY